MTLLNRLFLTAATVTAALACLSPSGRTARHLTDPNYLNEYMNTDWVPTLTQGATGKPTTDIQLFLAQTGDYRGPIDGIYGTRSARAVARFQARSGLEPDGIVGIYTWQKILETHTDLVS